MNSQVVTRFAPSPTGKAHAGSYRTAMYAWLFARKHGGRFILRIEDTDTARNSKEAEEDIYEALAWLGIDHDELYVQSKNLARHQELVQKLIAEDKAYISREEAKDGSGVIKDIIRFRNPNKIVTFNDLIRGEISTNTTDLGDFVIARNINEPLYHLAVVIDDHDEGVTHVIRAEEHIANTPRQILLIEALGWDIPNYAHLPLVLGPDKQKLSKRKGALAMTEYKKLGYLKDAVFNCIAMVGWNPADPGSEQEIFSRQELIERFDFARVQKGGAVFNTEKLDWFNREYLKHLTESEQVHHIKEFLPEKLQVIVEKLHPVIIERISHFAEVATMAQAGEFDYYVEQPTVDLEKLSWKGEGNDLAKKHLLKVQELVMSIDNNNWNMSSIKESVWAYTEEVGKGNVLWPFRFALTGRDKSPDPFVVAGILGKEETLKRIIAVCEKI